MSEDMSRKLAIDGGTPLVNRPLTERRPFGARELELLKEVIDSQTLFGPKHAMTQRFVDAVRRLYGAKYAVTATSGTAALHLAVGSLGLNPGDEVITAPITDMGTVVPILFQNAVPVFADTKRGDLYLDPEDVERKITKRTKAIIVVHLSGNPVPMEPFIEIARRHNLYLIEDCCQAHATELNGRYAGTFGDIGCFSMQDSKHVTTGDGGFCITNNPELADRMSLFADKGWLREKVSTARVYTTLALNYRMTALQAAVGLAQLEKVKDVVAARNRLGTLLSDEIAGVEGVRPAPVTPGGKHSYWHYPLITVNWKAAEFATALRAEGVPAAAGYIGKPIFLCSEVFYGGRTYGDTHFPFGSPYTDRKYEELYAPGVCPNCEEILDHLVILRFFENTPEDEIRLIAAAIRKVAAGLGAKKVPA